MRNQASVSAFGLRTLISVALTAIFAGAQAFTVSIDATNLIHSYFYTAPYTYLPTASVQSVDLAPGTHTFSIPFTNQGSGDQRFSFTVDANGLIAYDPSLEPVLDGAGTSTLTVVGGLVSIDASALYHSSFYLSATGLYPTNSVLTGGLIPGNYLFNLSFTNIGSGDQRLAFTVDNNGLFGYDAGLESVLDGAGTSTLAVIGSTVTLDASNLTHPQFHLPAISPVPTASTVTGNFIPGTYRFQVAYTSLGSGDVRFDFTVDADGVVAYDSALEGIVTGAGTSTITIVGVQVSIDATNLENTQFYLAGFSSVVTTGEVLSGFYLPGVYEFRLVSAPTLENGSDRFRFTVGIDGLITYDPALSAFLSGAGTTLILVGVPPADPLVADAGPCRTVYAGYAPESCTTLSATAEGGVLPYSFLWSNGSTEAEITVCPNTTATYSLTVTDNNGTTATDDVTVNAIDVSCGSKSDKVLVCHVPPGNPGNAHTICISPSALAAHLDPAHGRGGCSIGHCGQEDPCAPAAGKRGFAADANEVPDLGPLVDAYPNPVVTSTTIRFTVFEEGDVSLAVFDVTGALVATLYQGEAEAAVEYQVEFQADKLAPGLYLGRLVTGSAVITTNLVVAR